MGSSTASTPTGVRDIYVDANGIRHHLVARGSPGSPVVMMIHGLAGQAHTFDSSATQLAAKYHVYCLDVRGRGESGWGRPDGYHFANYVTDLEAVRAALGLDRLALVGTSMGALISMYYASQYPDHVSRVALNDSGPEADARGIERVLKYVVQAPEAFQDLKAVIKYYRENYAPMVERLPEDQVVEFARHNVRKSDSGLYVWKMDPAIRRAAPVAPPQDPWEAFKAISAPILILRGAQSDILSPEIVQKMVAAQPACRVAEVPNVGHAPLLNEPAAMAALDAFLAS